MPIEVRRKGVNASSWYGVETHAAVSVQNLEHVVYLEAILPREGSYQTEVQLRIDRASFEEVARAMISAAPDEAIRAFGSALADF